MIDFFSNLWIPDTFRFFLCWMIVSVVTALLIICAHQLIKWIYEKRKVRPEQWLEESGFSYDEKQDIFFSTMNPWQRKYGYCELYDEAAPALGMIIDCEPIKFEYEGKKWLIELWKGQYGMVTGCEVGVYTTNGPDLNIPKVFDGTFFGDTDEENHLVIEIHLTKGERQLLRRRDKHWWMTGFVLGMFSEPEELTLEVGITMKSEEMRDIFVDTITEMGYKEGQYRIIGETVFLLYKTPYSPKPITRTAATDRIIQEKNKDWCELYQNAVPQGKNVMEQLTTLQEMKPRIYREVLRLFRNKRRYSGFKKIQKYL